MIPFITQENDHQSALIVGREQEVKLWTPLNESSVQMPSLMDQDDMLEEEEGEEEAQFIEVDGLNAGTSQ